MTMQSQRATNRLAERDPQVYHPLDRLRGIIRRYVLIEGALTVALFASVWFALGLALDYGLFKVLGWDWVRDGARWVRGLALAAALGLFVAILVFRIARRLNKEFSYPALALVLERKFPRVLGDRLITAVEMADVEAMGRFGYSKEMIRATIAEARERVGKVPVAEAFNWKRLWVLGLLAVGLFLSTLAFAFACHVVATGSVAPYRFAWKFAHVTGIFAERNVALMNTPWPRRAHLELVNFPATGELTVSRDDPADPRRKLTVRAVRWVVADRDTPDGWRPLAWSDLDERLVGRRVPELPAALAAATSGGRERTVDDVAYWAFETEGDVPPKVAAFRAQLRQELGSAAYEELQEVFRALEARADQPSMGRTLRRLDVPAEVSYHYFGKRTGGSGTLNPQENGEFVGEIGGLKEDVEFVVRAADYETAGRRVRLIPPPTLRQLRRDQAEPAYLHHAAPAEAGFGALEGRLQKVSAKDLSLTGDRTVFVVPAGTELTITAEAYRADDGTIPDTDRIISAHAIPVAGRFPGTVFDAKAKPTQSPVPLTVSDDGSSFSVTFKENKFPDADGHPTRTLPKFPSAGGDPVSSATASVFGALRKHTDFRLTDNVEFKVEYFNRFNVKTTRSFLVQVVQDQPPTVEVAADVIRKSGNFYMVTPKARIPFNTDSFVKDDRGLSKVEYLFSYWAEDSDLIRSIRTKYALRSLLDTPLPGAGPAALLPRMHADNFRLLDKADDRLMSSVFVSEFSNQDRQLVRDTLDEFRRKLSVPKSEDAAPPAIKKVELKNPDRDYFDLKELHDAGILRIAAQGTDVQTVYRMDLTVQATDTNVDADSGPRVVRNAEPIRLRVVSESDLLIEIGREVDQLGAKLDEALVKLTAAKKKYEFVRSQYDSVASRYERVRPNQQPDEQQKKDVVGQLDALKVRSLDALQDVEKARDAVQSVVREFRRIARECEINRLNEAAQKFPREVADKLDALLQDAPGAEVAFPRTQALMTGVQNGLNAMSDSVAARLKALADRTPLTAPSIPSVAVTDAEQSLHALAARLKEIRDELGEASSKEKLKKELLAIKEKQQRIANEIRVMREEWEKNVNSPDPRIVEVGVVSLNKGESKRLEHKIEWRQYKEDELAVKVTASDPSITVTPELKLNFEQHQFKFAHEIKAGAKEGTYKVTLTPAAGKPIEVQVIVK